MRARILSCWLVVTLWAVAPAAAGVVKLATLVPEGSVWDKALKRMGAEWQSETDGRVRLRVYPGGVAGDEPDVLRKMKIGQLDAATLTVGGLGDIDPAFYVLSIPLFYDSYDELFYVMNELEPVLVERLRAQGYEFVHWGWAGWIHLFTTQAVRSPDDLKGLKIFVGADDGEMSQWWKRNGYRAVPLAMTDIMTGLQTGMIDVYPAPPLAALSLQWFRQTPYMHGLGLAPLVGATIFTTRSWNRLDEADRQILRSTARGAERELRDQIPGQDATSIEEMEKRGLTVVRDYDGQVWRAAAGEFADSMVEIRVPQEIYQRAVQAREAFRASAGPEGGR